MLGARAPPRGLTLAPAVLRNDPALRAFPELREGLDELWGGALWDPRGRGAGAKSKRVGSLDFACMDGAPRLLQAVRDSGRLYDEALLDVVRRGDLATAEELLANGADATHALHAALCNDAGEDMVRLLAAWSSELDSCHPRPVVITWVVHMTSTPACGSPREQLGQRPGDMGRLDALLAARADINAIGCDGETALGVVARRLRELRGASGRCSRPQPCAAPPLQQLWHSLVARGADAGLADGHGATPLERLSPMQCRELLSAKRSLYATRRAASARAGSPTPGRSRLEEDASPSFAGCPPSEPSCASAVASSQDPGACWRTPCPWRQRSLMSQSTASCSGGRASARRAVRRSSASAHGGAASASARGHAATPRSLAPARPMLPPRGGEAAPWKVCLRFGGEPVAEGRRGGGLGRP